MGEVLITDDPDFDVEQLSRKVVLDNLSRREQMISLHFKAGNVPEDARTQRLLNEIMTSQNTDVLSLLKINVEKDRNSSIDEVRDLISEVIKDVEDNKRLVDVPVVSDEDLNVENANIIVEDKMVELRDYLGAD